VLPAQCVSQNEFQKLPRFLMPACPSLKLAVFALRGLSSLLFEAQAKPSLVQNYYGEKVTFASIEPGDKSSPVWGYMSVPENAATPAATMVLVHGSGGLNGREARYVEEYNKLGHDFDGADNLKLHWLPKVQNARDCIALLEDDGSVIEPSTGAKWRTFAAFQSDYLDQAKRPCVKHGAHVGSNAAAKKKSLEDMTGFFRRTGFLQ
jgi:hypothetical protein